MNRLYTFAAKMLVLVFLVGPVVTRAQSSESEYRALLIQLIQTLQQQIVLLQAELAERQIPKTSTVITVVGQEGALSSSVDMIASYNVQDEADINRIKDISHRRYFTRVFELFPEVYEEKFKRLAVFEGEDNLFDAFVETVPPTHEMWLYAVHEDMLDEPDSEWNTELIVHELAHVVSYESVSGIPAGVVRECDEYFDIHGCPPVNSYMRQFTNEFWSSSDLDRARRFSNRNDGYESAYAYYDTHQDEFVTDYAAVGPEEDFSESFMFFMLDEEPPRGEASDKVSFFADYSDMVSMRSEIRSVK